MIVKNHGGNEEIKKLSSKRTRRSFMVGAAGAAAGYGFYRWLDRSPADEGLRTPLRKAMEANSAIGARSI